MTFATSKTQYESFMDHYNETVVEENHRITENISKRKSRIGLSTAAMLTSSRSVVPPPTPGRKRC